MICENLGIMAEGNLSFAGRDTTQLLKKYYSKIGWVMYIWAAMVAYSRIYMGVHYPGDVIVGSLVGILIGVLIVFGVKKTLSRCNAA